MFLLAIHIVAIAILIWIVWAIAYKRGQTITERRIMRQLEIEKEDQAAAGKN